MNRFTQSVFATALLASSAVQAAQFQVGNYTVWDNSKYYIDNQLNGTPANLMKMYNLQSANNGAAWTVQFDYTNSGVDYPLKYPAVHMGWHWGYPDHYSNAGSGLPFQLASGKNVTSSWQYNVAVTPSSGRWSGWNVSYDLWFHWKAAPTWQDQPNYELMIWNAHGGGQNPAGSLLVPDAVIGGRHYELWGGNVSSWYTFSFRSKNAADSTQNANHSVSLNPTDFSNYLLNSSVQAVRDSGFSKWVYLTSVQAGMENYNGTGHLNTTSYTSNVQ